ncbi:glycosyltransferase family 2 protein [Thalassobius sp. Cn5-15]|uniref:glycosyltransferase family 2 protein n=1 Tax=Thalassobius sp. Cn5-15 TaxID=2917763 RepID=UPI001EF3816C|nr:glycosyltransferase family 2 protein [Thalassobius sp. Cn5-15]MCG7494060.1 glycosyltransferase family 2 protein [Thalassobius sp. Cn5-15]
MSDQNSPPAPSATTVLCIVLNYRTAAMTLRAVACARIAMAPLNGLIVVVDNDSQDGSFEVMRDHVAQADWSDVTVTASGRNGGFGAGNNHGIKVGLEAAETIGQLPDFIYILNSDAFPEPDAIITLVNHMQASPSTGFAGSLIYGEDGANHLATFRFPSLKGELEGAMRFGPVSRLLSEARVPLDIPAPVIEAGQPITLDWVAGASLLMRREMLERIGLFDERYFLYFEETDLCLRGQRAGYHVDFVPHSRVMHIGSASTGMGRWDRTPAYWFRSRWYYYLKNHGRITATSATLLHLLGGVVHRLRRWVRLQRTDDPDHFLRDLLRNDAVALLRPLPSPCIPNLPATHAVHCPSDLTQSAPSDTLNKV